MNKWIYSSISLNLFAFLGFISLLIFIKPILEIISIGGSTLTDIIGFGYLPYSLIFFCLLCFFYLIEFIAYLLLKRYTFIFPYPQKNFKYVYYFIFYIGLIWGNGIVIFLLLYLLTYVKDFIFDIIKYFL